MAVGGANGMPSTNSGMKADWQAALLADSGPATPSMAPWPNFSGWREILLFHHVGGVGGDHRRRAGHQPDAEPDPGAPEDGADRLLQILEATG